MAQLRHRNSTTVTISVSRLRSVKASHAFEYRRVPVAGFGAVDSRTSTSLVFSFR
ncbi:MAG: hypothetical protein ABIX28_16370 [Vicinamibacterales bacterium]